jgi:hypothetical protein
MSVFFSQPIHSKGDWEIPEHVQHYLRTVAESYFPVNQRLRGFVRYKDIDDVEDTLTRLTQNCATSLKEQFELGETRPETYHETGGIRVEMEYTYFIPEHKKDFPETNFGMVDAYCLVADSTPFKEIK